MLRYVVDASVVAKWVLPIEPYQENALQLKGDHVAGRIKLLAPTILPVEVTNALWKAVKLRRLSRQDAREAVDALGNAGLALCEFDWVQVSGALEIACRLDSAIYDAVYLFLAQKTKAQFITSDDTLYEKAKRHFQVIHLRDYGTVP
jgi:predicted nucleic acid-binding protein